MTTTGGFDFNGLMRRVYEEAKNADPRKFAEEVFQEIPVRYQGEVLRSILPRHCSWYSTLRRMDARGSIGGSTKPSKVKLSESLGVNQHQGGINRKYAGWQEAWLKQRVAVETGWKFLGQCGVADLTYMIDELEENAAESKAVAHKYRQLRSALVKYKVDEVSKLPIAMQATFGKGSDA